MFHPGRPEFGDDHPSDDGLAIMAAQDKTSITGLYSSLSNGYCTALPFIYSSTKMKKMRCSQDDISIGSYLGTFYSPLPGQFWRPARPCDVPPEHVTGQCVPGMIWNEKKYSSYSLWGYFLGRLSLLLWNIWWFTFDAVSLSNCWMIQSEESSRGPIGTLDWKNQFICFNIG